MLKLILIMVFISGKVDYIGSSHQWWHFFVVVALYYWHNTGIKYIEYRMNHGCSHDMSWWSTVKRRTIVPNCEFKFSVSDAWKLRKTLKVSSSNLFCFASMYLLIFNITIVPHVQRLMQIFLWVAFYFYRHFHLF